VIHNQQILNGYSTWNALNRAVAHSETAMLDFPWYAVRVKHKHEKTVARSLEAKGYEQFLPLYQARRRAFARRTDVQVPLVPGYVFCRFNITDRLPVLIIPGVFHIVQLGNVFPAVDEGEIRALQTVVASGVHARPWPFLRAGQNVRLEEGPLLGLTGQLVNVNDDVNVVVSVTLLQRSVAVKIDRRWIDPVTSPPEVRPVPVKRTSRDQMPASMEVPCSASAVFRRQVS
jgi:transcription termination/antitermination protein NusG